MKDVLARLVRNPGVRKAAVALALAIATALGISFGSGCGSASVPPAVARKLAVLECQQAVLERLVPRAVAEDLVMAARAGNYAYVVNHLLSLGVAPEHIRDAGDAFGACETPSAPEPAVDAGAPTITVERS